MEILAAINVATQLASAGMALFDKFNQASTLISKAQSEGRTSLTKEEWESVVGQDDAARDKLQRAIEAAGG